MSSTSETALYLEFELLSEVIKEIQSLIEYNESNASKTYSTSILRKNSAYYSEINDAIFGNMKNEAVIGAGDTNGLCDAAEDYALKNWTKLEDAFKPKEHELAQFKTKYLRNPFMFNNGSTVTASQTSDVIDETCVTLGDVKHLLPAFLVKELEFGTEVTVETPPKAEVEVVSNKSGNLPIFQFNPRSASGKFNMGPMPVRHPFFGFPAYMGSPSQMQQQQRFNHQNFLYYPRSPIPPPGFPAYLSSINELKGERQKKIEELLSRGKERQSHLTLDDSLGVDVLKDDEQDPAGDDVK